MSGMDWNGNGREDAGDWYIDYEIMNHVLDDSAGGSSSSGAKSGRHASSKVKAKKPLTPEELERNGIMIRRVLIVSGLVFSVLTLWNNIGWLLYLPSVASWPGIIISVVVLVLIGLNVRWHHKQKKEKKKK